MRRFQIPLEVPRIRPTPLRLRLQEKKTDEFTCWPVGFIYASHGEVHPESWNMRSGG